MKKPAVAAFGVAMLMMVNGGNPGAEPANNPAFDFHRLAKRFMYGTLTIQSGIDVFMGKEQPLLKFRVLEDPPSIFINYLVPPDKVAALTSYLNLPNGLALTPISIIEGEEPQIYLSLNIYAVDGLRGLLSGNRAEWSVYASKIGDRPSYVVVDAKASVLTLDSVNWFTEGTELRHGPTADGIYSFAESDDGTSFESLISQAGLDAAVEVYTEPRWVAANDRIYWGNGVADRTYYDGNFVDVPVLSVDPAALTYADSTVWIQFVDPVPANVLVFQTGFELVITPWYNLDPE